MVAPAFARDIAAMSVARLFASSLRSPGTATWLSGLLPRGVEPRTTPEAVAGSPSPSFPLTYREGESEVMPIAFLNGTTAEMVYPVELPLGEVTIQPAGSLYDGVPDFRLDGRRSTVRIWLLPSVILGCPEGLPRC